MQDALGSASALVDAPRRTASLSFSPLDRISDALEAPDSDRDLPADRSRLLRAHVSAAATDETR
jgi:hypothetical protein